MGASTGNMLVDEPGTLERIFADAPLLVATHCEDTPTIQANEQKFRERYGDAVPMSAHPEIRSAEACYKSSSLAVDLAKRHGTRLHVLHLTTKRELELFDTGPLAEKSITAEVCAHHLFFDDTRYEELGAWIKCNPAIKTAADRASFVGRPSGRDELTSSAPITRHTQSRKKVGPISRCRPDCRTPSTRF